MGWCCIWQARWWSNHIKESIIVLWRIACSRHEHCNVLFMLLAVETCFHMPDTRARESPLQHKVH